MSGTGTASRRVERPTYADERREAERRQDEEDPRNADTIRPLDDSGGDDTDRGVDEAARLALLESENEALRRQNDEATTAAQRATQQARENQSRAAQAQEQQILGAAPAAKAEVDVAKAAYKTAREAGDIDAEAEASARLGKATAKLAAAEDTETRYKAWKAQQSANPTRTQQQPTREQTQNQRGDGEPTPESRAWLAAHPAYFRDADYQASALAAHEGALSQRIQEGSKEYVDYIDKKLEQQYGKNHGQLKQRRSGGPVGERNSASTSAPRGDGGNSSGGDFEFTHADGSTMRLVTEKHPQTGEYYETVRGTMPAEWREYARINRMKDVDYAVEQMKIQREIKEGGTLSGLSMRNNGSYQ